MKSYCIYCGRNKPKAHQICGSCFRIPESHEDLILSIILCHSPDDPHLNFLSVEEIEKLRDEIQRGDKLQVPPHIYAQAEEAYSAVKSADSPQLINKFSRISSPVFVILLVLALLSLII